MRKELLHVVNKLIEMELRWTIKEHGRFKSNHEGYAILLEELEELEDALFLVKDEVRFLWEDIKVNQEDLTEGIEDTYKEALLLVCEAVQVATMVRKFKGGSYNDK